MIIHPNTVKRILAGIAAVVAMATAFNFVSADQAKAITDNSDDAVRLFILAVGFCGTVWHPKHRDAPTKEDAK
ncbi:hypothetical protein [Fimbriimonas ginsengisoli]|uniref:Uncharacterized protein n=1 Tax=Fimbriimonas ginsengisoli Gsoil 348 TaxID=661478 RepID=A0A068NJ91_FIMGI|nr:hypothetical protein [Fimbriimonas ginsengisoli]AIE83522.1 hypothetical protein OP10G_0154 [Fimbriimonas ginsengisoli Gsoil 348]